MDNLSFAQKLISIGDREGAVKELARLLRSDPNNIDAWWLLARTIEDTEKMAECYRQILKIDPSNHVAARRLREITVGLDSSTSESHISTVSSGKERGIMKKCPYCAEEIQDEAIVCRYCGRDLLASPVHVQVRSSEKAEPGRNLTAYDAVGLFATFLFPLIGFILGVVYIVKQDARRALGYLIFASLFSCCWYTLLFSNS